MTVTICDHLHVKNPKAEGENIPYGYSLVTCTVGVFHVSSVFQACTGSGHQNKHFPLHSLFSLCFMRSHGSLSDT